AEIAEDIESIIDVLECSAELVAAVTAFGEVFGEDLSPLIGAHRFGDLTELFQGMTRVSVKNRRDDFFFGLGIVVYQCNRLAGGGRRHWCEFTSQRLRRCGGAGDIF